MQQAGNRPAPWWESLPPTAGGDNIIAVIGNDATGVAVGHHISQQVRASLGPPTPTDKEEIESRLAAVLAALDSASAKVAAPTRETAKIQLEVLGGELTKTGEHEVPNGNTITKLGGWLLDNVPDIAEALTSLFATPAVGRVVGRAGDAAITWVRGRFGQRSAADAAPSDAPSAPVGDDSAATAEDAPATPQAEG
jgi:hypothetical protein